MLGTGQFSRPTGSIRKSGVIRHRQLPLPCLCLTKVSRGTYKEARLAMLRSILVDIREMNLDTCRCLVDENTRTCCIPSIVTTDWEVSSQIKSKKVSIFSPVVEVPMVR